MSTQTSKFHLHVLYILLFHLIVKWFANRRDCQIILINNGTIFYVYPNIVLSARHAAEDQIIYWPISSFLSEMPINLTSNLLEDIFGKWECRKRIKHLLLQNIVSLSKTYRYVFMCRMRQFQTNKGINSPIPILQKIILNNSKYSCHTKF